MTSREASCAVFRRRFAECGEEAASLPAAKSDARALALELDKLLNAADPEEKDAASRNRRGCQLVVLFE